MTHDAGKTGSLAHPSLLEVILQMLPVSGSHRITRRPMIETSMYEARLRGLYGLPLGSVCSPAFANILLAGLCTIREVVGVRH